MNLEIKLKRKGFTLPEMLVYIAVLAIIVLAITSFIIWALRSNTKTKIMREVLSNSRRAIEAMTYEIREAKNIYSPTSVFNSHPGELSLEAVRYLPEGENKTHLDFYLCQDHLCLKKESQNPIVLTSDRVKVTNLVFRQVNSNPASIEINLKVEFNDASGRPERQAIIEAVEAASLRTY